MKKNLLSIVLMSFILITQYNCAFCDTCGFKPVITITPDMIPPQPAPTPSGGGNPAAAIAIGTSGGVLAAAGTAALSPFFLPGLLIGAAANMDCPLLPICLFDGKVIEQLKTYSQRFYYILKAISQNNMHEGMVSKYVLITDTSINAGSYNIVLLKLPKELLGTNTFLSIKITQISNPFNVSRNKAEIDSKLYINKTASDIFKLHKHKKPIKADRKNTEVPFVTSKIDGDNGILEKYSTIDFTKITNDVAILDTSYSYKGNKSHLPRGSKGPLQRYAVLIEFSNLSPNMLIK